MSKHTDGYEVMADGRIFSIASNWRGYGKREMQHGVRGSANDDLTDAHDANARLIAAAPQMLGALKALLREYSVNTLEEAAREYPYGKEDVADVIAVFDGAHAAIRAAEAGDD